MFHKHHPVGLLAPWVRSMWYRPALAGDQPAGMLVLPAGHAELVIGLDGQRQHSWGEPGAGGPARSWGAATLRLAGSAPAASVLDGGAAFGVSFQPMGLRAFSRHAMADLGDGVAPLDMLWGARADELPERLARARTPQAKFATMEVFLLERLREPHRAQPRVARAVALLAAPGAPAVEAVAAQVGLSPRQMLNLFNEDVGLTPKLFSRVLRFSHALRAVRRAGPAQWADVAAGCGYFDQAHLVRDFRALAGMSPTAYLARRTTGHANCLPWQAPAVVAPRPPGLQVPAFAPG